MNDAASGLIDIIEPALPAVAVTTNWLWLASSLAILLLLCVVIMMLWKKKWPAYRAIKRFQKLHQQIVGGEIPLSDGLVLLTQELRQGLKLPQQLSKQAPDIFKQKDKQLWPVFVQHLATLRYQSGEALTVAKINIAAAQIETWLRRYCC
jgi:hypothetical protein